MRMMSRTSTTVLVIALVIFASRLYAQSDSVKHAAETSPRVPELESFHTVIFKLWHDAWPKKDFARLSRLVPDIQKGVAEVSSAQLPGILREKKLVWTERTTALQETAGDYARAAAAKDTLALLNAGEKLHTQYERLVRTIRPVTKEVEEFHAALYVLYHYHLPAYAIDKIRSSAAELKTRMNALDTMVLPSRFASKQESFTGARNRLSQSVDVLQTKASSGTESEVKEAINAVHLEYQALERAFD